MLQARLWAVALRTVCSLVLLLGGMGYSQTAAAAAVASDGEQGLVEPRCQWTRLPGMVGASASTIRLGCSQLACFSSLAFLACPAANRIPQILPTISRCPSAAPAVASLLLLKNATTNWEEFRASRNFTDWDNRADVCQWGGITCDIEGEVITV